ncbi:MAG: peroxiredoxin, partial [Acidiferrobacterales bacterium]
MQPAPDFNLLDQSGQAHQLTDYRDRWLIIYFYPRDNTPGCTREACLFRDNLADFDQLNCHILGINPGNPDKHQQFAEHHRLNFPLLADHQGRVAKAYGALISLGPIKITKRHTFIINPRGEIAKQYRRVNVGLQNEILLRDLKKLQQE